MYSANMRTGVTRAFRMQREVHDNATLVEQCKEIVNRNPRNLERLRIARKPMGYCLEVPGHSYWHKLFVTRKRRYIVAEVRHFKNGPVVTVSSNEWGLKKQLYRGTDGSAYINVARLLALRCLEAGICEMEVDSELKGEKHELLLKELENGGIILTEPPVYKYPSSLDRYRPEKPWEIHE